jgi:hypothetical protein
MSTALTLYGTSVVSTVLSSAACLTAQVGGTETSVIVTGPPSGDGFVELQALGGSAPLYSSLPTSPTGKGWLFDQSLLDGGTISAGSWQVSLALAVVQQAGWVQTILARVWKRASSGSFTLLGTLSLSNQTITQARTIFTLSPVSFPSVSFAIGEKLYLDAWIQATGWGSNQIRIYLSSSSSAGVSNDLQVITPGYTVSPSSFIITAAGHNLLRDALTGVSSPAISYIALGNGTTPPTTADVALANELFRKAVSNIVNGNTGELLVSMYLAPNEYVGQDIQEVGVFGGPSASSSPNTGILIARGLWSHPNKQATESITFQIDLTV